MVEMKEYKIQTYEEAVAVIKEIGFLPLAPLIPNYPSLSSMTLHEHWHSDSEFDPWLWRTRFSADGVAAYGKFVKKKSVFISSDLVPIVKTVLGSVHTIKQRYADGLISREAVELFTLITEAEGIDTRVLRTQAGMKDKEKKKSFDNALLELQGSMDIVVSGTKEKTNEFGEVNGWSSTSFETITYWIENHNIAQNEVTQEEAIMMLKDHFAGSCSPETLKALAKIFKF
jgi:hypothetical protein